MMNISLYSYSKFFLKENIKIRYIDKNYQGQEGYGGKSYAFAI